jgi:hypothetical protein
VELVKTGCARRLADESTTTNRKSDKRDTAGGMAGVGIFREFFMAFGPSIFADGLMGGRDIKHQSKPKWQLVKEGSPT